MKIVPLEEVKNRINNRFPNQPYEIVEYTKVTQPFTIKCGVCGKIATYSNLYNFLSAGAKTKKDLCQCYNANNNYSKHINLHRQVLDAVETNPNIEVVDFGYRTNTRKYTINCKCKKCNQIFTKDWSSFLKNNSCLYCSISNNYNTGGFKVNLPQGYELLSEYVDNETKVLIKHECGFIWKVKPHNFNQKISHSYCGCPKCNHKRSKGEQKIANFLEHQNISFMVEQIFPWQSNPQFRYDFYLPDYNLVIEYMGQQHFYEVDFFHDTLAERQEHDEIKYNEAIKNGLQYLRIDYVDFNNIEDILLHWFNDYSARK